MDYKVLYRKYRPQDFDSIVGQEFTTKLLKNAVNEDKISHAYIFTGPRGTGKTSTAKIFAKAINCQNLKNGNPCNECDNCVNINSNPDIVEIDAASNNGVDEIRELINNVRLAPTMSKYKVYIIDEFHMLSTSAFNALLLTLEEPPRNVVFILATTDIQNVPVTILSRCQRFDFKPISIDNIVDRLKYICDLEKIDITDSALNDIALMANGGMRDALSILDQLSSSESNITSEVIEKNFGTISDKKVSELIQLLEENDAMNLINLLDEFRKDGINYSILVNKIITKLKNLLLDIKLNKYNGNLEFDDIYNLIFDLNNNVLDIKFISNPYTFIEIVLLKYIGLDKSKQSYTQHSNFNATNDMENVKTPKNKENIDSKEDSSLSEPELNNSNQSNLPLNKQLFDINIRVNNCFAGVKKEFLNIIKEKWDDFIIYESNANKTIMSYVIDTEVVAASNNYCIITNPLDSSVNLLNENMISLENDFNIFYGKKYRIVCLSNSLWEKEKKDYIFNVKNNKKYSIIDEDVNVFNTNIDTESNELESLANEIFGNNIEIK